MSSPFEGPPPLPFDTANGAPLPRPASPTMILMPSWRSSTRRGSTTRTTSAPAAPTRHAACAARPARILPRLLLLQERRLQGEQSASPEGAHRRGDGEDSDLLRDGEGQGHGGDRCAVHAVCRRDCGLQMADRGGGRRLCDRIRQNAVSRARCRAIACGGAPIRRARRDADVFGPLHRRPLDVRRREERLGRLSSPGRGGPDADQRVHAHGRIPPRGWRRPLGAAGAARAA